MRIELWILRTESDENPNKEEAKTSMSKTSSSLNKPKPKPKSAAVGGRKAKGSIGFFDDPSMKAVTPEKTLEGHKKAIREIAYSSNYKILVSVGFDFQVFVWNPYWEKEIISL